MSRRTPLSIGEWYHCYDRGVDKRIVFQDKKDRERFLLLLYAANSLEPVRLFNLKDKQLSIVLADPSTRDAQLVEIGAYCLMSNHVHLLLKEVEAGGISRFMQKIFTGYTMYFNKKYERTGALFSGTFKSKHIGNDQYLKQAVSYIHLNPVELFEKQWKKGSGDLRRIEKRLRAYPYSSLVDFLEPDGGKKILGNEIFTLYDSIPSLKTMLKESKEYHTEFGDYFSKV